MSDMASAGGIAIKIGLDLNTLKTSLEQIKNLVAGQNTELNKMSGNIQQGFNSAEKSAKGFFGTMIGANIVTAGIQKLAASLLDIGKNALANAGSYEKSKVAFETMLGSASKANALLKDIEKFSATTPFEMPGLVTASQRLLSFGVSSDKIVETLRNLGNAASGNQEKLDTLTLAYGKLQAKGKASLEELNMFTEAGVPILAALSKQYGVTTQEMFKLIESGKIGFPEVNKAIISLTTGTGQFAGMIEKQGLTFEGVMSTMRDNTNLFTKDLVTAFLPVIKNMALSISQFMDNMRAFINTPQFMAGLIQTVSFLGGAFSTLKETFSILKENLEPVIKLIGESLTTNLKKLTGETDTSNIAFTIFANVLQGIIVALKVGSVAFSMVITNVTNLILVIKSLGEVWFSVGQMWLGGIVDIWTAFSNLGKTVDKFVYALSHVTDLKAWQDLQGQLKLTGDSFGNIVNNYATNFQKIVDKVFNLAGSIKTFFVEDAKGLGEVWKTVYNELKNYGVNAEEIQKRVTEAYNNGYIKTQDDLKKFLNKEIEAQQKTSTEQQIIEKNKWEGIAQLYQEYLSKKKNLTALLDNPDEYLAEKEKVEKFYQDNKLKDYEEYLKEKEKLTVISTKNELGSISTSLGSFFVQTGDKIADAVVSVSSGLVTAVQGVYNDMSKGISEYNTKLDEAKTKGDEVAQSSAKMGLALQSISNVAESLGSSITSVFQMINSSIETTGDNTLTALKNNYDSQLSALKDSQSAQKEAFEQSQSEELERFENDGKTKLEVLQEQLAAIEETQTTSRAAVLEEYRSHLEGMTDAEIEKALKDKDLELSKQTDSTQTTKESVKKEIDKINLEKKQALEKTAFEKKQKDEEHALTVKYETDKYNMSKKIFDQEKTAKQAQIWVQFALGSIAAWTGAFISIPNPIAAAILGAVAEAGLFAAALASSILVAQQEYPAMPQYAEGVTDFSGGMAIVGEKGPEAVTLNKGSNVITNENLQELFAQNNTPSQPSNIVLQTILDSKIIAERVIEYIIENRRLAYVRG